MNAQTTRFSALSAFAAALSVAPMTASHAMGHSHGPTQQAAQSNESVVRVNDLESRQEKMEAAMLAEIKALRQEVEALKAQAAAKHVVPVN